MRLYVVSTWLGEGKCVNAPTSGSSKPVFVGMYHFSAATLPLHALPTTYYPSVGTRLIS